MTDSQASMPQKIADGGFTGFLDLLPLPAFIIDAGRIINRTNQACSKLAGKPFVAGAAFMIPGMGEDFLNRLFTLDPADGENPVFEHDVSFTGSDGTKLSGILSVRRFTAPELPRGVSWLALFQDTTSRNVMETIMETSFDNFIQTTNSLDAAMKKIKQQQVILSRFRHKILKEMTIAHMVQKSMLAKDFPKDLSFECYGLCRSSDEIGGDFLDLIKLDDRRYGFLVADVSGHGVAPALITAILKAWVHELFPQHDHLDTFFTALNKLVFETFSETGFYLTAMGMMLNLVNGELEISSAGHDALIRVRETDTCDLGTLSGGRVIGALDETPYTYQVDQLAPGDLIICHTDGISECRSPQGEFYGRDRIAACAKAYINAPLPQILDAILQDVDHFSGGIKPRDDQTLFIIRWHTTLE